MSEYFILKELNLSSQIEEGLIEITKLVWDIEKMTNHIKPVLAIVKKLENKIKEHKRKNDNIFYYRRVPDIHSMLDIKLSFFYKNPMENLEEATKRIVKGEKDKKSLLAIRIKRLLNLYTSLFPESFFHSKTQSGEE